MHAEPWDTPDANYCNFLVSCCEIASNPFEDNRVDVQLTNFKDHVGMTR